MSPAMLDTDILSEWMRRRNPRVLERVQAYCLQFGRLTISTLTVVEVVSGFGRLGRTDRLADFRHLTNSLQVLSQSLSSADLAGRIIADLDRTGQPVGLMDPMIAAIAIDADRTLVTGNTEHYSRIAGLGYPLRLENWRA